MTYNLYANTMCNDCYFLHRLNIFLLLYCFSLMIDLLPGEGFQMLKEEDNRNFCDVLSSIFFSLL